MRHNHSTLAARSSTTELHATCNAMPILLATPAPACPLCVSAPQPWLAGWRGLCDAPHKHNANTPRPSSPLAPRHIARAHGHVMTFVPAPPTATTGAMPPHKGCRATAPAARCNWSCHVRPAMHGEHPHHQGSAPRRRVCSPHSTAPPVMPGPATTVVRCVRATAAGMVRTQPLFCAAHMCARCTAAGRLAPARARQPSWR